VIDFCQIINAKLMIMLILNLPIDFLGMFRLGTQIAVKPIDSFSTSECGVKSTEVLPVRFHRQLGPKRSNDIVPLES